jgi:hypothetical protein
MKLNKQEYQSSVLSGEAVGDGLTIRWDISDLFWGCHTAYWSQHWDDELHAAGFRSMTDTEK